MMSFFEASKGDDHLVDESPSLDFDFLDSHLGDGGFLFLGEDCGHLGDPFAGLRHTMQLHLVKLL